MSTGRRRSVNNTNQPGQPPEGSRTDGSSLEETVRTTQPCPNAHVCSLVQPSPAAGEEAYPWISTTQTFVFRWRQEWCKYWSLLWRKIKTERAAQMLRKWCTSSNRTRITGTWNLCAIVGFAAAMSPRWSRHVGRRRSCIEPQCVHHSRRNLPLCSGGSDSRSHALPGASMQMLRCFSPRAWTSLSCLTSGGRIPVSVVCSALPCLGLGFRAYIIRLCSITRLDLIPNQSLRPARLMWQETCVTCCQALHPHRICFFMHVGKVASVLIYLELGVAC